MPVQVIMKQLIGTQIGQYQVEALLGEGGMGAVYRAHDLKHDRMVALKIMLANLAHKPQFRSRFMQEAEAIAHFSSPAIVTVYDTGTYEEVSLHRHGIHRGWQPHQLHAPTRLVWRQAYSRNDYYHCRPNSRRVVLCPSTRTDSP